MQTKCNVSFLFIPDKMYFLLVHLLSPSVRDMDVVLKEIFRQTKITNINISTSWNYSNKFFAYVNTSYKLWKIFEFPGQFSSIYSIIDSLWMAMGFEIT